MDLYSVYNRIKSVYAGASRALPLGYALPMMNLVVELTYRCNLRCSMCYQRNQERELGRTSVRPEEELTLAQIQHLIDQTPPYCIIIFSGGEPFCRKDLMQILAYAAEKRKCHIVTNGAMVSKEDAHRLVDLGLLSVGISIDGGQVAHDAIRGISGSFERTAQTFREIKAYRTTLGRTRPVLNMKTVISSANVGQLKEILLIGKELDADYCTFQLQNNSLEISALHLNSDLSVFANPPAPVQGVDHQQLENALQSLAGNNESPAVRYIPDFSTTDTLAHYDNRIDLSDFHCDAPWIGVNISPYGDVFPCLNYSIGNVKDQPLFHLWNHPRFRHLRQTLKQDGLFAGCMGCCDLERSRSSL